MRTEKRDVGAIGVGAAGLMCALTAGARHRDVLILDHFRPIAKKIRVSGGGRLADLPDSTLVRLGKALNNWQVFPAGTEGYRTAEVTLGGVDTDDLSSKTMRARTVPGLFFIGEVVDVTGYLGGYNFQWAWSSSLVAGNCV